MIARYFSSAATSLIETSMMKNVSSSDIMSPYVTTHSGTPGGASSDIAASFPRFQCLGRRNVLTRFSNPSWEIAGLVLPRETIGQDTQELPISADSLRKKFVACERRR